MKVDVENLFQDEDKYFRSNITCNVEGTTLIGLINERPMSIHDRT